MTVLRSECVCFKMKGGCEKVEIINEGTIYNNKYNQIKI